MQPRRIVLLLIAAIFISQPIATMPETPRATVWTFDRLDKIGGYPTTVVGHPKIVKTPLGKAIEFNGVDDALFVENHPLAGMSTFTFEATFRPDHGGAAEQRGFHLADEDDNTAAAMPTNKTSLLGFMGPYSKRRSPLRLNVIARSLCRNLEPCC